MGGNQQLFRKIPPAQRTIIAPELQLLLAQETLLYPDSPHRPPVGRAADVKIERAGFVATIIRIGGSDFQS